MRKSGERGHDHIDPQHHERAAPRGSGGWLFSRLRRFVASLLGRFRSGGRRQLVRLNIEAREPEAAERLLRDVDVRDQGHEQELAELLQHLDGHAAAVELARAFLKATPACSPRQYLARLRAAEELADKGSIQDRDSRLVDHALREIWERLDADARSAWLVLSEMAPDDAASGLLQACGIGEQERRTLCDFHLLIGDGQRWRLHRSVHAFGARVGTAEERRAAHRRFAEGYIARFESKEPGTGDRTIIDEDKAHLKRAITLVVAELELASRSKGRFLFAMGLTAYSAGDLHGAKLVLEKALALALANHGDDDVFNARGALANVLHSLGDLPQAKLLLEQSLASLPKKIDDDPLALATCRSNLARVLIDLGDLPPAKILLEQSLAASRKRLGDDHEVVTARSFILGDLLKDLGEFSQARPILERALASDLKRVGDDHPNVATLRTSLANVLGTLGDLSQAQRLLERALASRRKLFGDDHLLVATSRAELAGVLHALGDLPQAKDLLERALAVALPGLGDDDPNVAVVRANLASVLEDLGDLPQARRLHELALASNLKSFGDEDPRVSRRRTNLAGVLMRLGDCAQAKRLYEQALASDLKNFGDEHPLIAADRFNLAERAQGPRRPPPSQAPPRARPRLQPREPP